MKFRENLLPGIFLFLFLVLLASLAMYVSQQPPNSLPASTPPAEFSAERAFRHVEALAREPRPVGTAAHARSRKYIVGELQALGLSPQIQETTVADPKSAIDPKMSVAGTVQNVMARLAGTGGSKALLLVSHYDSVATGRGASDDASGVATLLETARALQAGPALKNDVVLLFTDGEEVGLLGARAFVEAHSWAKEAGLALNFDSGGGTGIVYTYETSPGNAGIIREYAKAVPYPVASSMMYEVYRTMPNDSDFTLLKKAGVPRFNFAHLGSKSRYHTLKDNPDNLDRRSLQHHGFNALSLVRHFGDLDLSNLRRDGNLVYFGIINKGLLYYPEAWALPLAILTGLIFIGLSVFGWRQGKVSLAGLLWGALAFLLNVLVSAGTVWLVWRGILKLYPQYGTVVDTYNGFSYWLAFITLTLAITAAFYNLLRRHLRLADLALGALLWWVIPTVVVSQMMPGISYWLQWPLLFSLIGLGLLLFLPEQEIASWRRLALLAAAVLPALLVFAWSIYAFYLTLGTDLIIVPVLLMALMLGLFIPHFDLLARPYPWALPATAGFVAVAALLAGSLAALPDAASPQADSIFYALNADTGQALWISEDPQPDVWTSQFLGTAFKRGELPALFPHLSDKFLFAPARYHPRPADRMPLARQFLPKNKTDTILVTKTFVFDRKD